MFCLHCGNHLPADAGFCNNCGKPQSSSSPVQVSSSLLVVRSSGPTNNAEAYPEGSSALSATPIAERTASSAAPYGQRAPYAAFASNGMLQPVRSSGGPAPRPVAYSASPSAPQARSVPPAGQVQWMQPAISSATATSKKEKSSGAAVFLEMLIPGLGLIYAGQVGGGVTVLIVSLLVSCGWVSYFQSVVQNTCYSVSGNPLFGGICYTSIFNTQSLQNLNGLAAFTWIVAIIWLIVRFALAASAARKYNRA